MNIGRPLALLGGISAALFAIHNASGYALIACLILLTLIGVVYATAPAHRRK